MIPIYSGRARHDKIGGINLSIVKVENLTKKFASHNAVKGISFELNKGKCIALLGPNGAGKTTTLRMLSGLLKPTSGTISFQGMNNNGDIREHIGYLPQFPVFHNWMTGLEFLIYVGQLARMSKEEAKEQALIWLERVGISDAKNRRIGKYSGGMKQRLGIAQAMIHRPKLLMLDEPVSALDPIGRREVLVLMEKLKEDTTLLFSTHILNDAEEVSDDLILMHNGELVEYGPINELLQKYKTSSIHLEFQGNVEEYLPKLENLANVVSIEIEQQKVKLAVNNMDHARRSILQIAANEDWPINSLEFSPASLEDIFMKAVKR